MNAELSAEAQADVLRIDAWWRANRPYAPNLFSEEVIDLLEQLATAPEGGENYKNIEGGAVRRTLLPKTRHYAYHHVDGESVVVLAVWSTLRADGPPLSRN